MHGVYVVVELLVLVSKLKQIFHCLFSKRLDAAHDSVDWELLNIMDAMAEKPHTKNKKVQTPGRLPNTIFNKSQVVIFIVIPRAFPPITITPNILQSHLTFLLGIL